MNRRYGGACVRAAAVLLIITILFPVRAFAEGEYTAPDIVAKTCCVIDGDSGEVLMEHGMNERMYPASTTKILTALIVLEQVDDLDQEIVFTESAVNVDISSSTLEPKAMAGEKMTVRDVLYGMLLKSGNECGAMLGEFVAGSEAAFAEMMNARAQEIGAVNSHFMNAYGIHDPEHYTTAYDLCLILREAMQNERYRELNGTLSYTIPATNLCGARTFQMGHAMLSGAYREESEGVIGGKTGSTPQAGKVLTTAAVRDGFYTISVLMGSDSENVYHDEAVLLEYVYGIRSHTVQPVEWVETHDTVVTDVGVRVRNAPSLRAELAGTLSAGTQVERIAVSGGWSKVYFGDKIRFIASDLLTSLNPEKVPETEPYSWPEEETEETEESSREEETVLPEEPESTAPEGGEEKEKTEPASEENERESTGTGNANETAALPEKSSTGLKPSKGILAASGVIAVLLAAWLAVLIRYLLKQRKNRQ